MCRPRSTHSGTRWPLGKPIVVSLAQRCKSGQSTLRETQGTSCPPSHPQRSSFSALSRAAISKCHEPGGLKTTETYAVIVLEARILKSQHWQGPAPSESWRGGSSLAPSGCRWFSGNFWESLACSATVAIFAFIRHGPLLEGLRLHMVAFL